MSTHFFFFHVCVWTVFTQAGNWLFRTPYDRTTLDQYYFFFHCDSVCDRVLQFSMTCQSKAFLTLLLPSAEILYAIRRWSMWNQSYASLSKVRWYLLSWKSPDLHHAAYSITTYSINAVKWSLATKVGRKWLYLLELVSLLILTLFLETTGESLRSKSTSRTGVMSAGGPGVSSPHGVSWGLVSTSAPCRKLRNSCWHQLISQTAAWLALSVPIYSLC